MHRQEASRSRGNLQSRNLQPQQNSNNNDGMATLVRGTVDDDRKRRRFRQRVNKKGLNASTASNSGYRTAGKLDTNSMCLLHYFLLLLLLHHLLFISNGIISLKHVFGKAKIFLIFLM